jgi:Type 9 secretion system plug protein 1st domain
MLSVRPCITLLISLCSIAWGKCAPFPQSSAIFEGDPKTLVFEDRAYEPQIKTIQLYPAYGSRENELLPAVIPLGQQSLRLEFDELDRPVERYYLRLYHCNRDWTKSDLADLEFLSEYNEFPIDDYEFSNDTQIPYIHYWIHIPPVKLPGNFVAVVYRGSDKEDLVLSKRFMVFDNRISFTRNGNLIGPGRAAGLNQQLNFTVNYKNVEIPNPMQDVNVVIRQNMRWDNPIQDVKPSFAREDLHELEYRFFDPEKLFKGGNEFRFFDLRSINFPGQNVAYIDKSANPVAAYIQKDRSRHGEAYSQYNDINGQFKIDNLDYNDLSSANYVAVNFTLEGDEVNGDVYVAGAFNYWNLDQNNRMTYDAASQSYHALILLKQGWYDYQYLVLSSPTLSPVYYEGSHFETENMYEIFVYYKPFQMRTDLLIGYIRLQENPR